MIGRHHLVVALLLFASPRIHAGEPAERPTLAAHRAEAASARKAIPGGPIMGVSGRYTYSNQVARILQTRCQSCHHDGDIAPFSLTTYADAFEHRDKIREMVETRQMPPWHVDTSCARFQDDPSLTGAEIATIGRWIDTGATEGDPRMAPAPLSFSSAWSLGEPDLTLTMGQAFTPDFSHGDVYRCFVLPTGQTEDRFVSAVEVRPGNRAVVHHSLLFVDGAGVSPMLDAAEAGAGYTCFGGPGFTPTGALGGWAPGNRPAFLPAGVGIALPANARVVMQIHYHEVEGAAAPDITSVGLHFARGPIAKHLYTIPVINQSFRIPAGASDYPVSASIPFVPVDVHLLGVTPHMHLLGKTMELTATGPGGPQCLLQVPDWDFHWQATYRYAEPIAIRAGSRIALRATYDNSALNPENPNSPPKEVGWGESTTDEMCIAFLSLTLDAE